MPRIDHRHVIAEISLHPLTSADHPALWDELGRSLPRITAHFRDMALVVNRLPESGIAWLSQAPDDPDSDFAPIRCVLKTTTLSFDASVLLALLLERYLAYENDIDRLDELVLADRELTELLSPFLPRTPNEGQTERRVKTAANRLAAAGILVNKASGTQNTWIVRPLIKIKLTADEAHTLRERLAATPTTDLPESATPEISTDEND